VLYVRLNMKHLIILSSLFLLHTAITAQEIVANAPIEPNDLGAHKWVLTATADEKSVVVFRCTTIRDWGNKKTTRVYDSICYDPKKEQRDKAFFIDPKYFSPSDNEEPTWHWCVFGGSGSIQGQWDGSSSSSDKATVTFVSEKWGKTTKIMEVFVKPYTEMKAEYPNLPDIRPNNSWSFGGSK